MKRLKSEKGSVTVLVIVTLVFFMIVLTTAYLAASNTRVSQLKETQRIKEIYEKDVENIESIYSSLLGEKFSDIYQSNTKYVDRDGKSVTIPKDFAVGLEVKLIL